MKRFLVITTVLAALAVPAVALALDIHANNKSVVCTVQGSGANTYVNCQGVITGLGNLGNNCPTGFGSCVDIFVSVPYQCTTSSGSNNPPGTNKNFVTGFSGNNPVTSNGNTYINVNTSGTGCPDKQTDFTGPATIHIYYPGTTTDVNGSPLTVPLTA
jgi:hypothetical protein